MRKAAKAGVRPEVASAWREAVRYTEPANWGQGVKIVIEGDAYLFICTNSSWMYVQAYRARTRDEPIRLQSFDPRVRCIPMGGFPPKVNLLKLQKALDEVRVSFVMES
ncbi:MAG: hypothetical protein BWY99_02866 [Synergistetes bacterium ADurb.BinA166]|nr:MAG: hypothetical protein BWY99_02866 [Synergistetes bacterium ADurb.BinA166]